MEVMALTLSGSSSSSEEHHRRRCKKLKDLELNTDVKPYGRDAKFSSLERKGKHYTKISCPNGGKKYVLLGDKTGTKVTYNGMSNDNSMILAEGVNIDLVAKRNGKRIKLSLCSKKISTQINNARLYSQKVIVDLDMLNKEINVYSENKKDTLEISIYPGSSFLNSSTRQFFTACYAKGIAIFWKNYREGYLYVIRHITRSL
ncbi:hypothetical protein CRE_24293 [Caenorhabditis remanei]|uniref:Uncharacterized protein n=1 Tax=Caenorhabditis remanei TaxID=31234 RepID=E3NLC3_CAERE|nr:hypothetical protein CRE_24293 [Caenorhabditis remanei]